MAGEDTQSERVRKGFLLWWPVTARLVGIAGAFGQAVVAALNHRGADPGFLTFCGALIAAPFIFSEQEKRNTREVTPPPAPTIKGETNEEHDDE